MREEPCEYLGQECSRQRDWPGQQPYGYMSAVFTGQQGGQCVWSRVSRVLGGTGDEISRGGGGEESFEVIARTPASSLSEMRSHRRILSREVS